MREPLLFVPLLSSVNTYVPSLLHHPLFNTKKRAKKVLGLDEQLMSAKRRMRLAEMGYAIHSEHHTG